MRIAISIITALSLGSTLEADAQQCPRTFSISTDGFHYRYEYKDNGTVVGRDIIGDPRGSGPDTVAMTLDHATQVFEKWNGWTDRPSEPGPGAGLKWLQCHRRGGGTQAKAGSDDIDTVTPQVPGCPRYLRKSLVTWRQVGNPQLNTWEIRNRGDKTLKVTFRDGGSNSSPDTLPPGQSTQVSLSANHVPSYVVRDFDELSAFNRANGANGKTLQCDLAIRPR